MAKLGISTGTNPNDGSGDSLLAGAVKINSNFNEVYAAIGNGTTVSTPVTSITAGDNIIVSGSTGSVTITGIGTADIDTDRINVSGVVTASSFSGSGVNLTNLPSSALVGTLPAVSGANLTGIATFIDAGANITVTTGPTGVTTIASSSGSATTSNVSSNTLVVTGVSTLGITSTTSLTSQQLNVSGVSTISGTVGFGTNITLPDGAKAKFGTGGDLEIYHSGTNSFIVDSGTGGLYVRSSTGYIQDQGNANQTWLQFNSAAGVEAHFAGNKKLETTAKGVSVAGIVTASSGIVTYHGDGSQLTDGRWTLGANGTSDYTFTGIGLTQTTNDPILYLARGRVYEFVNSMGAHPFEIRQSAGGSAYNSGVTNNAVSSGTLRFEIPFDAPNTLYYQCTSHAGMGSTIVVYPNTI